MTAAVFCGSIARCFVEVFYDEASGKRARSRSAREGVRRAACDVRARSETLNMRLLSRDFYCCTKVERVASGSRLRYRISVTLTPFPTWLRSGCEGEEQSLLHETFGYEHREKSKTAEYDI